MLLTKVIRSEANKASVGSRAKGQRLENYDEFFRYLKLPQRLKKDVNPLVLSHRPHPYYLSNKPSQINLKTLLHYCSNNTPEAENYDEISASLYYLSV